MFASETTPVDIPYDIGRTLTNDDKSGEEGFVVVEAW